MCWLDRGIQGPIVRKGEMRTGLKEEKGIIVGLGQFHIDPYWWLRHCLGGQASCI